MTPVYKRGSKEVAENYRQISLLLSIVRKTLERCVCNNLYHHVSGLISKDQHQHGFITNRSCVTQLTSVFHTIERDLNRNIHTDILYQDFAKAFDSMDHSILLAKLKSYGVTGKLWSKRSYLQEMMH